jgi:hypothetical protein
MVSRHSFLCCRQRYHRRLGQCLFQLRHATELPIRIHRFPDRRDQLYDHAASGQYCRRRDWIYIFRDRQRRGQYRAKRNRHHRFQPSCSPFARSLPRYFGWCFILARGVLDEHRVAEVPGPDHSCVLYRCESTDRLPRRFESLCVQRTKTRRSGGSRKRRRNVLRRSALDFVVQRRLGHCLVDKIRRIGPTDFSTSLCFCGPIHPTARMLLSGSDH